MRARTPTPKLTTYASIGQRPKSLGYTLQPITTQPPQRMVPFRPTRSVKRIFLASPGLFGYRPPVDLPRVGISSALPHLSRRHGSGVRTGIQVRKCLSHWDWTGDWPPPRLRVVNGIGAPLGVRVMWPPSHPAVSEWYSCPSPRASFATLLQSAAPLGLLRVATLVPGPAGTLCYSCPRPLPTSFAQGGMRYQRHARARARAHTHTHTALAQGIN